VKLPFLNSFLLFLILGTHQFIKKTEEFCKLAGQKITGFWQKKLPL